ncbi:hypothetical protein TCAL_15880 [Tigriopus californicus]|uniref:Uncharacterized protein n=1 Tax=Tigriopus californicus TaxID=6832 RepID=A0A553NQT0_TIGCA|nr:hypothetical protein TCAL_15880 [Tigriopus californicus]
MGQRYCSVPGCHSYFKRDSFLGVIFHRFPPIPNANDCGSRLVRRKNPTDRPGIRDAKKCNDPDSPSYVPTIFPHHQVRINALAAKRYHRKQRGHGPGLTRAAGDHFTAKVQLTARPAGDQAEETESVDLFDSKDRPVTDLSGPIKQCRRRRSRTQMPGVILNGNMRRSQGPRKWSAATQVCIPS